MGMEKNGNVESHSRISLAGIFRQRCLKQQNLFYKSSLFDLICLEISVIRDRHVL